MEGSGGKAGLLERRRYSERPPRYEYVLTQAGRDFRPVLWAFVAWGNKHFAPEGPSVVIVDSKTGAEADPMLVDRISGRPLVPQQQAQLLLGAPGGETRDDVQHPHRPAPQTTWWRIRLASNRAALSCSPKCRNRVWRS